ncbi:MAG: hypothetical protein GEU94_15510 [Micromonosporaceae bacterium]|nr:hypothetical protein [Micromonosporaceae bacterium]
MVTQQHGDFRRPETFAHALSRAAIDDDSMRRRHGPLLEIGRKLLGVVPNCDPYLEIWPTAFTTYNLLVPNLLNVPTLLRKSYRLRKTVGLVVYTSSRAAGCMYCSAHACTFALRRGVDPYKILLATRQPAAVEVYSEAEQAAIEVADSLGRVPSTLTDAQRDALWRTHSPGNVEWLVLAIGLMGWLNKFMDTMTIPLEESLLTPAGRVIGASGWVPGKHLPAGASPPSAEPGEVDEPTDTLSTLLGMVPLLPTVIWRTSRWMAGVPGGRNALRRHLLDRTGHDFPVLVKLRHRRARKALATVLLHNADPRKGVIGMPAKALAGLTFAHLVGNPTLIRTAQAIGARAGLTPAQLAGHFAGLSEMEVAAVEMARAASTSPSEITPDLVAGVTSRMSPAAVIELTSWLSVMQLLHRLQTFYGD